MKKIIGKKILCAGIALCMLVSATGCGAKENSTDLMTGIKEEEKESISTETANMVSESAESESVDFGSLENSTDNGATLAQADAASVTDFAVRLFQQSLEEDKNTLISPLSVISALGMTANGAEGDTLAQMEQTFGIAVPELNEYLCAYREALPEEDTYKLSMANAIWFRDVESFTVKEEFLQTNANYYDAAVRKAPFDQSTLEEINKWVSDNTDGMIKDILNEISQDAVMYLVNALAFDAEWETIYYDYQVRDAEFTKEDGTVQDIELMYSEENAYLEDDNTVGFMKYYDDRKYAFVALLPDEEISISEYVESLTGEKIHSMLTDVSYKTVNAAIPKFESEYSVEMAEVLAAMGMTDAFDEDKADFSGMGHSENGNLYISRVLHKTFIAVDEKGTKAGAATLVEVAECCAMLEEEPVTIYLDRPFVYMIVDCEENVPVFIGVVRSIDE